MSDLIINGYLEMPGDITEIKDDAFAKNKELRHADLSNVRYIGAGAFRECSNLESVTMSNAVVIGPRAFEFCKSLRSITIGDVTEIGEAAFSFCGMLDVPSIPRSVTKLGAGAFSHTAIRRVDLNWMGEIPPSILSFCTSLEYADISSARIIGKDAFAGCVSLSVVRFGPVRKIGARAFHRCGMLEISSLPDTLEEIGDDAFSLVHDGITVPKSVRSIGKDCFGPIERQKKINIYKSSLHEFRNYFRDDRTYIDEADHFYLWESAIDVTVLDDQTDDAVGFLPLYSDLNSTLREALTGAFRTDNSFDYSVLDSVLFEGMGWNQRGKDRLAVMRSRHPYELDDSCKAGYIDYLDKHSRRIARRAVEDKDVELLRFMHDNGMFSKDNISWIVDYSISLSASECTAFLLECQSELNGQYDPLLEEL